jgi:uncharacterized protein (DUF4415 family)
MTNKETIVRFTAAELAAKRARGESRTDRARILAKTESELERDIASDSDWRDVPRNWAESAEAVMPQPKQLLSLRLDQDVVRWFRDQGPGYQTRINAVLRVFMQEQTKQRRA